jgi:hypothetical protein
MVPRMRLDVLVKTVKFERWLSKQKNSFGLVSLSQTNFSVCDEIDFEYDQQAMKSFLCMLSHAHAIIFLKYPKKPNYNAIFDY